MFVKFVFFLTLGRNKIKPNQTTHNHSSSETKPMKGTPKQYGLILPKRTQTPIPKPKAGLSLLADDDDVNTSVGEKETGKEILSVNEMLKREAEKKKKQKQLEQQHKKALEEDPTVFEYDSVYEDLKESNTSRQPKKDPQRKSKYIGALLEQAKRREKEDDIVFEKKLQRELEKDADLYADKPKFITPSYRKKLEENKKWQEEEERRHRDEDVTKQTDLGNFYRNLLTNNIAFGSQQREQEKEEKRQTQETKKEGSKTKVPASSDDNPESKSSALQDVGGQETKKPSDHKDVDTPARKDHSSQEERASQRDGRREREDDHQEHHNDSAENDSARKKQKTEVTSVTENSKLDSSHRNDETAILSAKERYLQRKRAASEAPKTENIDEEL